MLFGSWLPLFQTLVFGKRGARCSNTIEAKNIWLQWYSEIRTEARKKGFGKVSLDCFKGKVVAFVYDTTCTRSSVGYFMLIAYCINPYRFMWWGNYLTTTEWVEQNHPQQGVNYYYLFRGIDYSIFFK